MVKIFTLLLLTCLVEKTFCSTTCRGVNNKKVDWFIIYKLPRITDASQDNFREGTGMVYMDDLKPDWLDLNDRVTEDFQPVYYTMNQVYDDDDDEYGEKVYLMYNDKTDEGKYSSSKAHSKGSLSFDKKSGFWLIHSVPGFPTSHEYLYPDSGTIFGQIFLCVTFKTDSLELIASQLGIMNPQIYDHHISPYFKKNFPEMSDLLSGSSSSNKNKNKEELLSQDGTKFVSFAKSKQFGKDLYLDFVVPSLKSNLLVKTWLNGKGDYESDCSMDYSIRDVWRVKIFDMEFKNSKDHSKWAISDSDNSKPASKNWICVGDINRQSSQEKRGGGTLCFQNGKAWKAFINIVQTVQHCDGKETDL